MQIGRERGVQLASRSNPKGVLFHAHQTSCVCRPRIFLDFEFVVLVWGSE